jgi:hypothetical protein
MVVLVAVAVVHHPLLPLLVVRGQQVKATMVGLVPGRLLLEGRVAVAVVLVSPGSPPTR